MHRCSVCGCARRSRHPSTLASINNYALLLQAQGDLAGAAPLFREALEMDREMHGE